MPPPLSDDDIQDLEDAALQTRDRTQKCLPLSLDEIAAYLGWTPNRARVVLRNLANGRYALQIYPDVWVFLPNPKLKPGDGLVGAADAATSVADLQKLLLAALPAGRIQ